MGEMGLVSREVSWNVMGIEIFGTITLPDDGKAHPGIVLVAGSGPTDRNWCSPLLPGTNGSGKLLAEALARKGYVTMRYDKMASGPHARENLPKFSGKASMESHAKELAGAIETLASSENARIGSIFALTNSEGAIHAVNYQAGNHEMKFRGLVLTGPPGRSVGEVARSQLVAQGSALPNADLILAEYDGAVSRFLQEKPMDIDSSLPDTVKMLLNSLQAPPNLPFSRELWAYSLRDHLGKIKVPVLVIIGKKDIQVNWEMEGSLLEEATSGNNDVTFSYPENANHVLKHEELPLEKLSAEYVGAHYNSDKAVLDGETMDSIVMWLEKHQ